MESEDTTERPDDEPQGNSAEGGVERIGGDQDAEAPATAEHPDDEHAEQ